LYEGLLDNAATATSLEKRMTLMTPAEDLPINEYRIAPLYFYLSKHMVEPRVAGLMHNVPANSLA
jgi:ABC-type oligopeptide transport system substrate-binding subunit